MIRGSNLLCSGCLSASLLLNPGGLQAQDNSPPALHSTAASPSTVAAGSAFTLNVQLTDSGSGVDASQIIAAIVDPLGVQRYSLDGFVPVGGDAYEASQVLGGYSVPVTGNTGAALMAEGWILDLPPREAVAIRLQCTG